MSNEVQLNSVQEQLHSPTPETARGAGRKARLALFAIFTLLLLYPPLYSLGQMGIKAVFGYFAADAFYYLTIARNSVSGLFLSFDGEKVTNGFHPLWEYFLIILFKLFGREQAAQLYLTFLASCFLTTLGLIFTGWAVQRVTRSLRAALWLIPGVFFLLFRPDTVHTMDTGLTYTYSCWAFMNGMESPLTLCFGGLLVYLLSTKYSSDRRPWSNLFCLALGLTLMLCVLARLDDIFLILPFVLFIPHLGNTSSAKLKGLAILILPTFIALSVYLYSNHLMGQSALPISGKVKAVLSWRRNLNDLLGVFFPPIRNALDPNSTRVTGFIIGWILDGVRVIGLFLPAAFATFFGVCTIRARRDETKTPLGLRIFNPLLAYVIFKSLYNFINVSLGQQGYWYFAFPILIMNFYVILFVWQYFQGVSWPKTQGIRNLLVMTWSVIYLLNAANAIHRVSTENWYYDVWQARNEITGQLKATAPSMKLIDCHDGILAYSLGLPAISGIGLAVDPEGFAAINKQRFWDYCIDRGYDVAARGETGLKIFLDKRLELKEVYRHGPTNLAFSRLSIKTPPSKAALAVPKK